MSHRNERIKERLIGAHLHPESRKVKQAKRNMRHNMRVQISKDASTHLQNQTAGKFNWFKAQVAQFREVDPRLLPTETEHKALMKELSKSKKKRDVKYIPRPEESDSGLESELDDEDEDDDVPAGGDDQDDDDDQEGGSSGAQQQQEATPVYPEGEVKFPDPLTAHEVRTLAYHYTQRNNEELAELQSRRNPPTGAIKRLKGLRNQEQQDLRQGMEVPELTTGTGVSSLLSWDGYDRTVTKVDRTRVSFDGNPKTDLLPFNPMGVLDVKLQRPGVGYQEDAAAELDQREKINSRRAKKLTASGEEKIGFGDAAKLVANKVGAKFVSTEDMVMAGRKRRAKKNQVDTKRRFHQAIARSRLM